MNWRAICTTILALSAASLGHAQATRTWVSGVGDDANPCSRTAPCKTFAGAISKTAAGGEISALDPGGFGGVTITKSITLNGDGNLTSIFVEKSNGITINAQPKDVVILRHLSITGATAADSGVRMFAGGTLVVEKCAISGFTQHGIEMATSGVTNLAVSNTTFVGGATGVRITSGTVNASLHEISVVGATNGIYASSGNVSVSRSVIAQNAGVGVLADTGGIINLESNMLTGNGTAIQSLTGSTIRLSNNDVFDNITGFRLRRRSSGHLYQQSQSRQQRWQPSLCAHRNHQRAVGKAHRAELRSTISRLDFQTRFSAPVSLPRREIVD